MFATHLDRARDRARNFIWKNARLLDRQLFARIFDQGDLEPVLRALSAYQNSDGGFGNALEPDKRDPNSQPVDIQLALEVLDLCGALEDPGLGDYTRRELVLPACDFLVGASTADGGVPFALPSVNRYPRQPWWNGPANPQANLNPTAAIAGLLRKHRVEHPWLETATAFCWRAIAGLDTDEFHTLMPVITFLESAPDRERAGRELNRIAARLQEPGVVEMDPQAGGYVKLPLDWAPTPDSFCRGLFSDETLRQHLEGLASRQAEDGGWPLNWEALSPGSEMEWRGWVTIQALDTLRAYETANSSTGQ